jgi:hypothetical protein
MHPKISRTVRSWEAPSMSTLTATIICRILESGVWIGSRL